MRSFYSVQTVCLAVACEYLGKLCVLGVVKRRRSRVCAVCGMFVGAAIFAGSICALSRNARVGAEVRSGKCEFAHVMGCYESKKRFNLCARMYIAHRRFCRAHLACLLAYRRGFCSSAARVCVGSGTRVELQRFGCVACASPVSLVVERVLVCFLIKRAGRSE